MKNYILFVAMALAMLVSGCSSEKKAAELLDTARFEEKQNNHEHAIKLYENIIKNHPGTPAAKDAKARLQELRNQVK